MHTVVCVSVSTWSPKVGPHAHPHECVHAHVDFWLEFPLSFERHLGTHMLMCLTVCSAVKYINHSRTHLNSANHENANLSTPDVEN